MIDKTKLLFTEIRQHLDQSQIDEAIEKFNSLPPNVKDQFDYTMIGSRICILKKDFKNASEIAKWIIIMYSIEPLQPYILIQLRIV